MKRFELEQEVARILATQFYSGWTKKAECKYTREEYFKASLHNWMDAARGLIHLVEREKR